MHPFSEIEREIVVVTGADKTAQELKYLPPSLMP